MKARPGASEDRQGLEDAIKEFGHLNPRDEYAKKLAELKEHATHEQAETKKAILTKNAQAQINDVQAMIDRYLDDDDGFKAYRDALARGKLESRRQGDARSAAAETRLAAKAAEVARLGPAEIATDPRRRGRGPGRAPKAEGPRPAQAQVEPEPGFGPAGPTIPF